MDATDRDGENERHARDWSVSQYAASPLLCCAQKAQIREHELRIKDSTAFSPLGSAALRVRRDWGTRWAALGLLLLALGMAFYMSQASAILAPSGPAGGLALAQNRL